MKKMLAKAVALSLVLGGVGFVANDALAAEIGPAVDVETIYGGWDKVLSHKDGQAINAEVATNKANIDTNKANIAKNAENISANKKAIDKEVQDRKEAITQERNARTVAELNLGEQITQEKNAREEADNKLGDRIDANKKAIDKEVQDRKEAITQERNARTVADLDLGDQITKEKNARVEADNKLSEAIKTEEKARKYDSLILDDKITQEKNARIDADKAEAAAREDADKALRADLNQETIDRVDADNRLQTAIDQKADKTTVAENTAAIESNKAAIAQEKKDRDHADQKLQDQITINKGQIENEATNRANEDKKLNAKIDAETDARKDADNALRTDLNQETIDRVDADNRLQTAIDQKADKTTVAENTAAIESNKAAIAQEKKDRDHADQKLQDQITINKGQIENEATNRANEDKRIEAKFDGEVSRLDGRIDKLNDNVQKVGAMAAAIANLHTMGYDPEAPTEIAVGVGQYRDKTGMALGAFHYPNRDFMLSFSVSTAGDEFMGGIGATWKFGRKSPEELRQAEAEKAAKAKLAKAEAAKKAAKDARVAAQQKRHAEMLAARTGK